MLKIIVRLRGGLGNQLFSYAAARRMALVNKAELVIDDVTGFARDRQYRRQYALDKFSIPVRKATATERMEPFERYRRGLAKWISRRCPFEKRTYLEQEGIEFDPRLLNFRPTKSVYLDGLWQSEEYFKDVVDTIRQELQITPPHDPLNRKMREKIELCDSVAIHFRWFDAAGLSSQHNLCLSYYSRAVDYIRARLRRPHFFLFSDDIEAAAKSINLPAGMVTCVEHNSAPGNAYADLWLMIACKHIITGNSTFSWWGAWLREESRMILTPGTKTLGSRTAWAFEGLLPDRWTAIR